MGSLKILKVEVLKLFLNIIYWFCSLFLPYQKNAVLLLSSRSDRMSVGMEMLYEELVKDESIELTSFFYGRNLSQIELLKCSVKAVSLIAKHHVIVVDDHCVPLNALYWKHKRNVAIQIWHAAGTFKKFGNLKDTKTRIPHKNYDIVCVNSEEDSKIYAQALGVKESQIRITGALQLAYVKQICDSSLFLKNEYLTVFYAPTYRSGGSQDTSLQEMEKFIQMIRNLNLSIQVKVSVHPYLIRYISQYPLVKDCLVAKEDFYVELLRSDILVTDYSSLIYDYSYTGRPILFFVPDLASYMEDVGMIDLDIFQGGSCFTKETALLNHIVSGEVDGVYSQLLKNKVFSEDTSIARDKVISLIMSVVV